MARLSRNENWPHRKQKSTPCICPRCKIKHEKSFFWTGSIPARKFCPACEQIATRDYTPDTYTVGYMDKDNSILS